MFKHTRDGVLVKHILFGLVQHIHSNKKHRLWHVYTLTTGKVFFTRTINRLYFDYFCWSALHVTSCLWTRLIFIWGYPGI